MSKKTEESKSDVRAIKRRKMKLTLIIAYIFETTWALGVSVVAAMVISTSTRNMFHYLVLNPRKIRPSSNTNPIAINPTPAA